MKVILVTKASGENYSVEAGLHDGVRNFDHHGPHSGNPAPCNNSNISIIPSDATIELTHTDTDSLLGVMRMMGKSMPQNIDISIIEKIDLNGSSAVSKDSDELAYMVAVTNASQNVYKIPRAGTQPQDITSQVESIINYMSDSKKVIEDGKELIKNAEIEYQNIQKYKTPNNPKVIAFNVPKGTQFDPSRPYHDGYMIVVVYREAYESISIYGNPQADVNLTEKPIYAGVKFAGHTKACGSERGQKFNWKDAVAVATDVANKFNNWK